MKLKCTSIESIYKSALEKILSVGAVYSGKSRKHGEPGAKIGAVNLTVEDTKCGKPFTLGLLPSRSVAGEYELLTAEGKAATFTASDRLQKSEKRIAIKIDGVGLADKRRVRRTYRQYSKIKFIAPGYHCPVTDRKFKDKARNHRR